MGKKVEIDFCGNCDEGEMGFCGSCTEGISAEEANWRAFKEIVLEETDIAIDLQLGKEEVYADLAVLIERLGIDPETWSVVVE